METTKEEFIYASELFRGILTQEEVNNLAFYANLYDLQNRSLTKEEKESIELFFEKAVDNQDLNAKLTKAIKFVPKEMTRAHDLLASVRGFSYKTQFAANIDGVNKKLVRNLDLLENKQNIQASERVHLSEMGMLYDTYQYKGVIDSLESFGIITSGGKLDKINSEAKTSQNLLERMSKRIDSAMDIQSGDLYFTHTNKQNALMNRDPRTFYEKAKNHITKYQHASTLYKKSEGDLVNTYNTYISQIENYIDYAEKLNELQTVEYYHLYDNNLLSEYMVKSIQDFTQENKKPVLALKEKLENYKEISQSESFSNKDLENVIRDMQPFVDNMYRQNNDKRSKEFYWSIVSNIQELKKEIQVDAYYDLENKINNLNNSKGDLLNNLYELNNIIVSLGNAKISHINSIYEQYDLYTKEAIMSDQYRIDPVKLVKSLEAKKILQEKLGDNWATIVRGQFTQIASEIHGNNNHNYYFINDQNRMISAGLADYGLASSPGDEKPEVGIKGKIASYVAKKSKLDLGDFKFGNQGHISSQLEEDKYEKLRDSMLGRNGQETSQSMICSEFATKMALTAIVELNDWIEQQIGEKKVLDFPVENKEVLHRVHPQRMFELLNNSGCLTVVKNPALESLINTDNHNKRFYVEENRVDLLYKRVLNLAEITKNDSEEFVKTATNIFKAYMLAENPNLNENEQEMKEMLVLDLKELHALYNKENPEKFLDKLKQLVIKVKEFSLNKLGYKFKSEHESVKSRISNILKDSLTKDKIDNLLEKKHEEHSKKQTIKKQTAVEKYASKHSLRNSKGKTAVDKYLTSRRDQVDNKNKTIRGK